MMSGVTFAHPWVLGLLLVLPLAVFWRHAPRMIARSRGTFLFSRVSLLRVRGTTWRARLVGLPDLLMILALGALIVAMARPQSIIAEDVEVDGIDIYLALDMSGSMRALDLGEQDLRKHMLAGTEPANRFISATETLKGFVQSRQHDRIGMVVFAKDAYLQFPLTLDYNTILNMLGRLRLGDIDTGGTAIGNALGRAIGGLKDSEAKTKIIILITDGDRRGGNISPRQAATLAKELGVKIFPILVGKEGAALVPVQRGLFGGRTQYQRVEFPINPKLLQEIAETTGGTYTRVSDAEGLRRGLHEILDRFERSRIKDASNVEYQELYEQWAQLALVLLIAQLVLRHTVLRTFP